MPFHVQSQLTEKQIELTVHNSYYCVLDLICVKRLSPEFAFTTNLKKIKISSSADKSICGLISGEKKFKLDKVDVTSNFHLEFSSGSLANLYISSNNFESVRILVRIQSAVYGRTMPHGQKVYYPPASKASKEVANLTETKNLDTPVYGVKEFVSVHLL